MNPTPDDETKVINPTEAIRQKGDEHHSKVDELVDEYDRKLDDPSVSDDEKTEIRRRLKKFQIASNQDSISNMVKVNGVLMSKKKAMELKQKGSTA